MFWLHDVADVWVYASKASIDTDHVLVMLSSYFILLGSWGYLRLYAFPRALLQMPVFWEGVAMSKAYQFSPNVVNTSIHNIQVAMLWMLIVLHYMWYGMFVQIGYAFFAKGVKEDTQAKIMVESLEGEAQGEKDHNDSKDCNSEPVKQNTPQISELRKRLQQIVN